MNVLEKIIPTQMKSLCTSGQLDNLNSCGWSVVHNGTPLWLVDAWLVLLICMIVWYIPSSLPLSGTTKCMINNWLYDWCVCRLCLRLSYGGQGSLHHAWIKRIDLKHLEKLPKVFGRHIIMYLNIHHNLKEQGVRSFHLLCLALCFTFV